MKRDWCRGAGMTAPLKMPASLVDCPSCGRQNLNGELPAAHGLCTEIRDGVAWYVVPRHREAAPSLKDAERAHAANARHMRTEDERFRDAFNRWNDSPGWDR